MRPWGAVALVIRRVLSFALLPVVMIGAVLVLTDRTSFFRPGLTDADTLSSANALLGALVQATAGIAAISVAVLFVTAQLMFRPERSRVVTELYSTWSSALSAALFLGVLSGASISLARANVIVASASYWVLDLNLLVAIAAFIALIPFVLGQIENLNPAAIGRRVTSHVTMRRIRAYGLSEVHLDPNTHRISCELRRWTRPRAAGDPLGSYHEVVMMAVDQRDRILLSHLTRLALARIARYANVPFSASASKQRVSQPSMLNSVVTWTQGLRPSPLEHQLEFELHVLHYVVRRAHNLRREWGDRDVARQEIVADLGDLVDALASRTHTGPHVELALFAMMHISLGYADVERYGFTEPLLDYARLARKLSESGHRGQAQLCATILGLLSVRTHQLPPALAGEVATALGPDLSADFMRGELEGSNDIDWTPRHLCTDPWSYMTSAHPRRSARSSAAPSLSVAKRVLSWWRRNADP